MLKSQNLPPTYYTHYASLKIFIKKFNNPHIKCQPFNPCQINLTHLFKCTSCHITDNHTPYLPRNMLAHCQLCSWLADLNTVRTDQSTSKFFFTVRLVLTKILLLENQNLKCYIQAEKLAKYHR